MVPDSDILNTFLDQLLHCTSKRILLKSLVRKVPPKVVKQFTGFMLKPVKLHILEEAISNTVHTPESPITPKNTNSHIHQVSSNTNASSNNKTDKKIEISCPSGSSASSAPTSPTYKILLVDDNIVNCRVGQKLIQKLGHTCDIATSGHKALELFHSQKYDMIFMDIIMPEMDGYTTTKLIREIEKKHCLPRTPIVALTAVDSSDKGIDEEMVTTVVPFFHFFL
jgi:CheY-like chemotaxis protein